MKKTNNKMYIAQRKFEIPFYLSGIFMKVPSMIYSAVITALLIDNGFSMKEIGTIWSITLFADMILDFPTGGFADRYGRLKIFAIGMTLMGLGRLLYTVTTLKYVAYFAAFLLGAGESQVSGTISPWFMQNLEKKDTKYIHSVFANDRIISNITGILAGFGLAFIHLNYVGMLWIAGLLQIFGGIGIYLFFKDNYGTGKSVRSNLHLSVKSYMNNKIALIATLLMVCVYTFYTLYLFIWQPIGKTFGISGSITSSIQSLYLFSLIIGNYLSKIVGGKAKANIPFLLFVVIAFILLIFGNSLLIYLLGIILFGVGYGAIMPFVMGLIQLSIEDDYRASLTSLISSLSSIMLMFLQIILGLLIDHYSYTPVLLCAVSFTLLSILIICMLHNKKRTEKNV